MTISARGTVCNGYTSVNERARPTCGRKTIGQLPVERRYERVRMTQMTLFAHTFYECSYRRETLGSIENADAVRLSHYTGALLYRTYRITTRARSGL